MEIKYHFAKIIVIGSRKLAYQYAAAGKTRLDSTEMLK